MPTDSRKLNLPTMHVAMDMLPEMPGTNDYADSKKQFNNGQLSINHNMKKNVHITLHIQY